MLKKTTFFEYSKIKNKLSNKVYYYYYYYLFHPKVITALLSGDNKIENLTVTLKIRNKSIKTKINIEYPEYLVEAFQTCKNKGGTITLQIKTIYNNMPIDNIGFLEDYNALINEKSTTLSLYPNFVCVKNGKVVSRYVIIPVKQIRGTGDKRYIQDFQKAVQKS